MVRDTRLDSGIVISPWEYRITDEEHLIEWDIEIFFHLIDTIFFIDSLLRDIYRRRTTDSHLEVWKSFL